jgi:hypothetical protein
MSIFDLFSSASPIVKYGVAFIAGGIVAKPIINTCHYILYEEVCTKCGNSIFSSFHTGVYCGWIRCDDPCPGTETKFQPRIQNLF